MTTPNQLAARQDLAVETSRHLIAMEQSLDHTLTHGADLVGVLSQGRMVAGLGLNVGADAMAELTQAIAELGATRRRVAGAHAQLAAIVRKFGLDETQMIIGGDKDPSVATAETLATPVRRAA